MEKAYFDKNKQKLQFTDCHYKITFNNYKNKPQDFAPTAKQHVCWYHVLRNNP